MGVTPWGGQVSTPLPPCLPSHLDLHGHLCAVPQHALVHLPDGGSCKGHLLQRGHLGLPVPAELLFENSLGRVVMTLIIVVSGSWVRALCWALHVLITPLATCRALGQALGCYPTLRMRKQAQREASWPKVMSQALTDWKAHTPEAVRAAVGNAIMYG